MKKKIIIAGLLMGVLSLNSCVKDNESDAVRDQRNAQTEKLKAEAEKVKAEAEYQKALAAVQNAQAELDKAKQQYLVETEKWNAKKQEIEASDKQIDLDIKLAKKQLEIDAAVQSATVTFIKAKEKAEIAATEYKEAIEVKTAAAILKAKVTAENELTTQKSSRLEKLVTNLSTNETKYKDAINDVVDKEKSLVKLELRIAQAKAGTTSVEDLYKKYVEDQKIEIEKKKAEIEAYKQFANTDNPEATYAKLKAAEVAKKVAEEAAKKASEEAVSAKDEFEKADFEADLGLKAGEIKKEQLSFFNALTELYRINNKTIKDPKALDPKAKDVRKIVNKDGEDYVRAILEEEKGMTYDLNEDGTKTFMLRNLKTYTEDQLVSRFIDENFVNFEIKRINAGTAAEKDAVKNAKQALKDYIAGDFKSAEDDYKNDPKLYGGDYQAAIDKRRTLEEAVTTAEVNLKNSEEDAINLAKYREQAREAAKEVVAKIAEFNKAQEAVVAKAKVFEEKLKESNLADAKFNAIDNVIGADGKDLTVDGAKAKISKLQDQIADLESALLDIDSAKVGATDLVKEIEQLKQKAQFELDKAKQVREAYKRAYEQSVADLDAYLKDQEKKNS